MRRTASRPHRRAISLALEDHGEIVPRRGTTSSGRSPPACEGSPYRSNCSSTPVSPVSSARAVSTKCQCSAEVARMGPPSAARRELSLSSRNAETARLPRSLRINDMGRAGKERLYRKPPGEFRTGLHNEGTPPLNQGRFNDFETASSHLRQ